MWPIPHPLRPVGRSRWHVSASFYVKNSIRALPCSAHHGIVVAVANRAHRRDERLHPCSAGRRQPRILRALIGVVNRLVWIFAAGRPYRAPSTSSVRRWSAMAQPAQKSLRYPPTERVKHDREVQIPRIGRYTQKFLGKVMSATQSWSGSSALKSRSTRSGTGRAPSSRIVVEGRLRRLTPRRPAAFIRRATRFLPRRIPSSRKAAWTRGAP